MIEYLKFWLMKELATFVIFGGLLTIVGVIYTMAAIQDWCRERGKK